MLEVTISFFLWNITVMATQMVRMSVYVGGVKIYNADTNYNTVYEKEERKYQTFSFQSAIGTFNRYGKRIERNAERWGSPSKWGKNWCGAMNTREPGKQRTKIITISFSFNTARYWSLFQYFYSTFIILFVFFASYCMRANVFLLLLQSGRMVHITII